MCALLFALVALVALAAAALERHRSRRVAIETATAIATNHAVFEAIPDGLALTDERGDIVRLNAVGRMLIGVEGEDERESRTSLCDRANPLVQALREGSAASGLEVAIMVRGEPRVIQVKLAKLNDDPSSHACVAVFRDVTRERLLERDLRQQSIELEANVQAVVRATQHKTEFVANMSHELRTPLNAILGFTELLGDGCYGALTEKQQRCTMDVHAAGRHLLGLINAILDLSKIEAGRVDLAIEDLDIAQVASQALTFVRPQAAANGVELRLSLAGDSVWVRGDADRVRQVMVNLLSNAVKFTAKGHVDLDVGQTDDEIVVSVTDTGIGVAASDADKLFRPFSQVDSSVTRRFGGTGLGLAICKRLVEMHGGRIGFESPEGGGARFWFTLRRAERQLPAAFAATRRIRSNSARAPRLAGNQPASVLILDANSTSLRILERMLCEHGVSSACVTTLADARAVATTLPVQAIVLDPEVSDGSIADVLGFARQRFGASFVVVSARGSDELGVPSRSYLAKPTDRAALAECVEAARRRAIGRRALVIDPSGDAASVGTLLEDDGFDVEFAGSMGEARTALGDAYSLVVIEPALPDGDGLELLEQIGRHKNTGLIALTQRTLGESDVARLTNAGALVLSKGSLSRSTFLRHVGSVTAGHRRRRVLAVDDNEQNLRLVATMLTHRGYDVLEARDAMSAVDIARAERPDLILMDVVLPGSDGLTATRKLKGDVLTNSIPVIAVTAHVMAGDAERALSAGCTDYVAKPVDSTRLLRAVERALAT